MTPIYNILLGVSLLHFLCFNPGLSLRSNEEDLYCDGPFFINRLIMCYRASMTIDAVYLVKDEDGNVVSKCQFNYPYAVNPRPRQFGFAVQDPGLYIVTTEVSRGIFNQEITIEVEEGEFECYLEDFPTAFDTTTFAIGECPNAEVYWEVYREFPYLNNQENCVNPTFMGKVDIARFWALWYFRPADVFYNGKEFTINMNKMPIGWLEIRANIFFGDKEWKASRLMHIQNKEEPLFIPNIAPYSENLPWSSRKEFVMSTIAMIVPYLTDESGLVGRAENFLRFTWMCDGPNIICDEVSRITERTISISGKRLRKCAGEAFSINLIVEIIGRWDIVFKTTKRVSIMKGSWPIIDLVCLQNCNNERLFQSVPQKLALICMKCEEDRYKVETAWPQCELKDGRCRWYMYYNNWQQDYRPRSIFELHVFREDGHETFSFPYKFLVTEEGFPTDTGVDYDMEDKTVRYIMLPKVSLIPYSDDPPPMEIVEVKAVYNVDDEEIQFTMFSTYQAAFRVPINIETDDLEYIHEFPEIRATQCARAHCNLIGEQFAGLEDLQEELVKSTKNRDISKLISRLKFAEGVYPIRLIIQLFLIDDSRIFHNRHEMKHKWSVQMMQTLLQRITYSQAEISLIILSEAIPLFDDRYKREMVTMALTIADKAIGEIGKCTTDVHEDSYRKQCRSAKTLFEILNWWRPAVMDETSRHCLGKRWQLLWEKLVLVDSNDEGYHIPEVFAFPQRSSDLLSAEFNRMRLYWKIRSQKYVIDYMVHISIFHSSRVISPKPWIPVGAEHEDIGTTVIDMLQELTGVPLDTSQSSNSLLLKYARSSYRHHRADTEKAKVTLESKYSIKDGKLVRNCHWIVIPTTTEVLRTITISFHSNQRGMKFSIKFMRSKDEEAFINFHDDASTNYTRRERVYILDKVSRGMKSLTRTTMQCDCKRSGGVFSADIITINNHIRMLDVREFIGNISLYAVNDEGINPQIALLIVLWLSYLAAMVIATKRDFIYRDMFRTHIAQLHFNPEDKFRYLICFKTSALPQAGTNSRAWITLIGNLRQTAGILLDNECGFERASECWFLVSCAYCLGDIVGVYVKLDNTEVDDNWRINQVEVFDANRDILFRFPNYTWLSQTNSSQLCTNENKSTSLTLKLFSTFGEMIRNYHIILCFFLNIPGARSMANQITRLHSTFMWCQVATIIFITGQPIHRFEGAPIEPKLSSVITALPVVLVLNLIYIRLRMFLVPNESWRLQWPHTKVPDARIAIQPHKPVRGKGSKKRFKMKAKLIQMLRRNLSIRSQGSQAESNVMPKLAMISNIVMINAANKEALKNEEAQKKAAAAPKNMYDVTNMMAVFGNLNQSAEEKKDEDEDLPEDSIKQQHNTRRASNFLVRWMRLVTSGRGSVKPIPTEENDILGPPGGGVTLMGGIRRGWWENDPMFGSKPVFGFGIHTFTTKQKRNEELSEEIHRYRHDEEHDTGRGQEGREQRGTILFHRLLGYNLMIFLICLNLGISTAFIGYSSYYFRSDKIKLGMVYSSFVFAFIVFVVEPSVLFLLAFMSVIKSGASSARLWAKKRASDVTEVMGRWNEVHDKNYIKRSFYFPPSHYNGLGSINHSNMMNRLHSHDNTAAAGGSERKYRGSLSLPVFLICVIVIMNVHGSVNSAFRQKNMIYKALDFTDEVEHKAPNTDEMWEFLELRYLNFFHARDGTFSLIKTRVFSKIRQVRIRPLNKRCSAPRLSNFTFPNHACHGKLTEHTLETRNWTRDWESIIDSKVVTHTDRIFKYTPPDVNSMLEYVGAEYPLGGYEYVLSATYADNSEMLRKMRFSHWVDDHTRALIVEASVYDFNTGIATALVITYHFSADGIRLAYENQSFAFSYKIQYTIILSLAIVVLASLTLIELSTQYAKAVSFGVINYMKDVENMMTVVSLSFYTFILVGFVLRYQLTSVKYSTLSRTIYGTDGALFLNMRDLGFMVFFLNGFSGFLAFTALMTIFQSAKNIPKLYIMLTMIRNVFILSTFPAIVIIMMAMGSHLLFQTMSYEMSTLKRAVYAVLQFVLDPKGLQLGYPAISNSFTVIQWGAFFVIIANGFQVALNEDYSVLVMETKKQGSKSMLASLTEMALASAGVINLEDPNTDQIADRMEDQKRQEEDDLKALKMFAHMSNGW